MGGIEWNPNWEHELRQEVEGNLEAFFNQLASDYRGRPKEDIRAVLRRELEMDEDPDEEWVDAIHAGDSITLDATWA